MFRLEYVCLLLAICFCSCSNNNQNSVERKVFKYNQADNISSLDPAFAKSQNNMWAVNQIYDGLVGLNDSMEIIPRIAKEWMVDSSGRKFTFVIDQRYRFHENDCFDEGRSRVVKAQDVVYSFKRILSDKVNSPGSWIFSDIVDDVLPFVAKDDTTFILNLKKPFQPIMGILTMQYCSVVAKEAVKLYGKQFRSNPVGTGPFEMKRWQENHALYLSPNLSYPNINHNLDGIKISFIPDKKIAFFEFLNGNLDFFSGIESSFGAQILDVNGELKEERKEDIVMFSNPYLNLEYIGINMELAKGSVIENEKFRKALNYAINRSELVAILKNNIGEPAVNGVIPKGLLAHNNELAGYNFDPSRSKALLNEIGDAAYKHSIKVSTNADYLDIITYIAKSWENLGLEVDIDLLESAVLRQQMREGTIQFFRASWIADYPDEESYLCLFYGENPAPPNYTRYYNKEFDQLYSKAIVESNQNVKHQIYQKMDSLVINDAPIIPIYYDETALFVTKSITNGISANSLNLLDTRNLMMR